MLFGKKLETTLENILNTEVVCPRCNKPVSFSGNSPLTVVPCPRCQKGHIFVPLNIGRFWLSSPLGGGGMGAVYKAFIENEPGREAAVKILPSDQSDNPVLIENLVHECRVMQDFVEHPCIVNYIDSGHIDGEYFLATEYLPGERLDRKIQRQGALSELETIYVGMRLLQALSHIYNCGYLYRDLKPENVMVNERGVFLFDFGICMDVIEAYNDTADIVQGSPLYISPERMVGETEKVYSEIYSLGMVLYHCVKGKPYYESNEIEALTRKHARKLRLSNVEQKMKGLSPELSNILVKMIERSAHRRYQNYFEVECLLSSILVSRSKS